MSDRNLTTSRRQVFGDVEKGQQCRVCGRDVDDGRAKHCSDYCRNLAGAVMSLLNWDGVRRRVIDRDDETCQVCGWDQSRERAARRHIRGIIDSKLDDRPQAPSLQRMGNGGVEDDEWEQHREEVEAWQERRDELKRRYGAPEDYHRRLEVDHIQPISDGGHPFDPGNLQTLCRDCHGDKTAEENSTRPQTPSKGELSESLFQYVGGDGQ